MHSRNGISTEIVCNECYWWHMLAAMV